MGNLRAWAFRRAKATASTPICHDWRIIRVRKRQRREPSFLIAMELVEEDCLQLGRLVGGEVVLLRLVPLACIALGDLVVQVAGIPPGAS